MMMKAAANSYSSRRGAMHMYSSIAFQSGINGLLFISVLSVFLLLIYEYVSVRNIKKCAPDAVIFLSLVLLISYVSGSAFNGKTNYEMIIPQSIIIVISIVFIIYSAVRLVLEKRKNKERLTPNSVKEALDNLNSGICFIDENSRIVLMNYAMGTLISSVLKRYPQTLSEINDALDLCEKPSDNLYRFDSGAVWQLSKSKAGSFTQISLNNVTELFEANRQLEAENERLAKTNEEIQRMLERLADRIREQETLSLKMQIHHDIGTSLIRISKLINESEFEDIDKELAQLESAVSYFSNTKPESAATLDEMLIKAEGMGVEIKLSGILPDEKAARELILTALGECITNCVIHANGNRVYAEISENPKKYTVTITNNGEKPKEKITEGGGLSSLRTRVENSDGEMLISSENGFELRLILNKENADDQNNCC